MQSGSYQFWEVEWLKYFWSSVWNKWKQDVLDSSFLTHSLWSLWRNLEILKKSPPVYREDEEVPEMNKNWQLSVVNLSAPRDGETNGWRARKLGSGARGNILKPSTSAKDSLASTPFKIPELRYRHHGVQTHPFSVYKQHFRKTRPFPGVRKMQCCSGRIYFSERS